MWIKSKLAKIFFRFKGTVSCQEVEKLAYDFLEGRLDPKTEAAVEKHMQLCPPCGPFIESYRRVKELGSKEATPPLDPQFKAHLKKMFEC